ncbi:concanavalin A-like lectin/glucanase domain-containing protein [Mycena sp. CBHHK59/15]|nr:concanavalin A-like lectin/glucanase domain-containing protein [Mycena sp. CBHHK59/15]
MYTLVVLSLSFFTYFLSAEAQICNGTSLCPAAAPCCSEFGYCGTGNQFCLAGCNPFQSHTLDSCRPGPLCKSTKYTFNDASRVLTNSTLNDGDATKYDWVVDGGAVSVSNGELSMLLTETNNGVRLSSTRFVHYGTLTATISETGRWNGVVAGFVTMSNIRDEIDWEFPGAATTQGQTNYFWQGLVTTPNHGGVATGLTDTYENYHDYTIVWSPDSLVFQINGKTVRTIKRRDTIVDGVSRFPNTPSRIQLSLWPAGTTASAPGTIQWAGGLINWADKDYTAAGGHFTARVKSVSVKCGDPTPPSSSVQGYIYSGGTLISPTIAFTDESTLIGNTTDPVVASAGASSANTSTSASSGLGASSSSGSASLGTAATTASASASVSASATGDSDSSVPNPAITSTTTLGNDAVSAAPASISHGGSFFGNGGLDASSVSVSLGPSASASDSATTSAAGSDASATSASGTPTKTESGSSTGSSGSAGPSKTPVPNAATPLVVSVELYGFLAALMWLVLVI